MPTRVLGPPQSTETDWRPDKKFRPDLEAGRLRTNNRLPSCPLAEGGPGELASSMGEGRGVQGLAGGCWLSVLPALLLL